MKSKFFSLATIATGLLVVAGCASTHDKGPYLPVNTKINNLENVAGVLLLDRAVQYSVACPSIQETRLPDGRLRVIANLRNRENRRIQVQADCEFKDAQGFSVDKPPFVNVFLDENAQTAVQFESMTSKAVRYTVHVRQAR
jgi:hypothetical protein